MVGTDKEEGLESIQRGFEHKYNQYGRLKKDYISSLDYETQQAWKRIQRHVIVDGDGLCIIKINKHISNEHITRPSLSITLLKK